jgi:hypothetical protein
VFATAYKIDGMYFSTKLTSELPSPSSWLSFYMAWNGFGPCFSEPSSSTNVPNTYQQLFKGRETDLFVKSPRSTYG